MCTEDNHDGNDLKEEGKVRGVEQGPARKRLRLRTKHVFWMWTWGVTLGTVAVCFAFQEGLAMDAAAQGASATVRNVAIIWAGLIGLGLATWRSHVAERQAEAAKETETLTQFHEAVKWLDGEKLAIRVAAVQVLWGLSRTRSRAQDVYTVLRLRERELSREIPGEEGLPHHYPAQSPEQEELKAVQAALVDIRTRAANQSVVHTFFCEEEPGIRTKGAEA